MDDGGLWGTLGLGGIVITDDYFGEGERVLRRRRYYRRGIVVE